MNKPEYINIPILNENYSAVIEWQPVENATKYKLERKFNAGFDDILGGLNWQDWENKINSWDDFESKVMSWEQFDGMPAGIAWEDFERRFQTWADFENSISSWSQFEILEENFVVYEGPLTTFTDLISNGARTALYRVSAYVGSEYSEPLLSDIKEVIPNRPPITIRANGTGNELGVFYKGFSFFISLTDPDPQNTVSFKAYLEGAYLIGSQDNVQQGVPYELKVSDDFVFGSQDNSRHKIVIKAVDQWGAESLTSFTFATVEDLSKTAIFYVLRDNIPIAKTNEVNTWTDYLSAGTHTYKIRGIDKYGNFVDSNEIVLSTNVESATLAQFETPEMFIKLKSKRGGSPSIQRVLNPLIVSKHLEGRVYPIYSDSGFREDVYSIAFSFNNESDNSNLEKICVLGNVIVYRDKWGNKVIGYITSMSDDFVIKRCGKTTIDFNFQVKRIDYDERINYD